MPKFLVAVDMNGNKVSNVGDPTSAQDAATKSYADTKLPGKITVSNTAPTSPAVGDIWVDTN